MTLNYYWKHLAKLKMREAAEHLGEVDRLAQEAIAFYEVGLKHAEGITQDDVRAAEAMQADASRLFYEASERARF